LGRERGLVREGEGRERAMRMDVIKAHFICTDTYMIATYIKTLRKLQALYVTETAAFFFLLKGKSGRTIVWRAPPTYLSGLMIKYLGSEFESYLLDCVTQVSYLTSSSAALKWDQGCLLVWWEDERGSCM
jgi:hypothetical protein